MVTYPKPTFTFKTTIAIDGDLISRLVEEKPSDELESLIEARKGNLLARPSAYLSYANADGEWLYAFYEALERLTGPDYRVLLSEEAVTFLNDLAPAARAQLRRNSRYFMEKISLLVDVPDWEIYYPERRLEQLAAAFCRVQLKNDRIFQAMQSELDSIRAQLRTLPVPDDPEPDRLFGPDEEEIFSWQLPMLPEAQQQRYRRLVELVDKRECQLYDKQFDLCDYCWVLTGQSRFPPALIEERNAAYRRVYASHP